MSPILSELLNVASRLVLLMAEESPAEEPLWITRVLRENLGPPLKSIQEPIDAWLGTVPMWVAMACTIGLFLAAVVWVWRLKRDFIFRGAPGQEWWRDLRIWATLVVVPYIAAYLILGL